MQTKTIKTILPTVALEVRGPTTMPGSSLPIRHAHNFHNPLFTPGKQSFESGNLVVQLNF